MIPDEETKLVYTLQSPAESVRPVLVIKDESGLLDWKMKWP